jgi:hypothetical protein
MGSAPLHPTYQGYVATTYDALILFEACLAGKLLHVPRRPHDRERSSLIQSGNVFIYEEHASGIKRWTDGVPWSPSRILNNFLVYRELERPFPPGEKKRAMKRNKKSPGISKAAEPFGSQPSNGHGLGAYGSSTALAKETERALIGSLIDSYGFKDDGLVKKTISITLGGVSHHLVSYYSVKDVLEKRLGTPTQDNRLQGMSPRSELIHNQNFRASIHDDESMDRLSDDRNMYGAYGYGGRNAYEMTNQSISQPRPMSLPTPPQGYTTYPASAPSSAYGYSIPPASAPYSLAPAAPTTGLEAYAGAVPTPGIYQRPEYDQSQPRGRFNSTGNVSSAVSSTGNRAPMPQAGSYPARRSSTYEHSSGSFDSGISGMSSSSSESKPMSASYTQQTFYDPSRDSHQAAHNFTPQPQRSSYLPPAQSEPRHLGHFPSMDTTPKDVNWAMSAHTLGNNSIGHGHFVNQQQWAGAAAGH